MEQGFPVGCCAKLKKVPKPVFVRRGHSQMFWYQGPFRVLRAIEDVKELRSYWLYLVIVTILEMNTEKFKTHTFI